MARVKCTHCGGGGRYYFTGDACTTCFGFGSLADDEYCPCYGCRTSPWPRKPWAPKPAPEEAKA